jgi:DNA-binding IclR family transcriptional regulator
MRQLAVKHQINVGLAMADLYDMVYLESFRFSQRTSQRTVVSGQRIPMELTSLGRAYLAVLPEDDRQRLVNHFCQIRRAQMQPLRITLESAFQSVATLGYCAASWQPQVIAVASPLTTSSGIYVLNLSVSTSEAFDAKVKELAPIIVGLRQRVGQALQN